MTQDGEVFIAFDTSKLKNAVAVADSGRNGESRYLGKKIASRTRCTRRAAVKEGVVASGGVTLLYASRVLGKLKPNNDDRKVGIDIVRRALQAPARQIFENAGVDGSIIVGKLLEKGEVNHGFDAQSGNYVDMVKAGIIDPTKVVRLALQGAASIAALLITTEAMVAEKPEKAAPTMLGGGMDGTDF